MKFKLEFDMDNAAFEDYPPNEIAFILADMREKMEIRWAGLGPHGGGGPVRDSNGNRIGTWEITR